MPKQLTSNLTDRENAVHELLEAANPVEWLVWLGEIQDTYTERNAQVDTGGETPDFLQKVKAFRKLILDIA